MKLRRQLISEATKEKELRSEYPQLVIDTFQGTAALNADLLDLNPDRESVEQDVSLFLKYNFHFSN